MALTVYKPGQGYWTRVGTAISAGVLVLWGVYWATQSELSQMLGNSDHRLFIQAAVAVGLIVVAAGVLWWVLNKAKVVDFMIATDAEMRKVSWPSWHELVGSTWVVICGTFLMAILIFVVDVTFTWFFQQIYILPKG